MSWPGLCESDNIKPMITLTVITLSGAYCSRIYNQLNKKGTQLMKIFERNIPLRGRGVMGEQVAILCNAAPTVLNVKITNDSPFYILTVLQTRKEPIR